MNESIHDFLQRMEFDGFHDSMTGWQRVNAWRARLKFWYPTNPRLARRRRFRALRTA